MKQPAFILAPWIRLWIKEVHLPRSIYLVAQETLSQPVSRWLTP